MEERSRGGDFRLSHDALIKSSSDATSSLLVPPPSQHHGLVPPMMLPSLDAYLDAYRSLMSHDVQAMSASLGAGCGGSTLGMIRPPGLTMPVLPTAAAAAAAAAASFVSSPYYGLSLPYSGTGVDLARYGGLLSPVYVPPYIAPLLCGGAGAPGLLPPCSVEAPAQASPSVVSSRPPSDTAAYPSSQCFSKSLLEACAAAARKNDSSLGVSAVVSRATKQQDARPRPARHTEHPHPAVDRTAKPFVPPRTVATVADPPTSDRKWNPSSSGGKVDRGADVVPAGQSSSAVDFSNRLTSSDVVVGVKSSSVSGSAMSADSWKFSPAAAAALNAGKNAADNSTYSYGTLTKPVALQCASDQKKPVKVDVASVKAVRNGTSEREVTTVKATVDSHRVTSLAAPTHSTGDQTKHRVNASQNDEAKIITEQSDAALAAMCHRVTSSGLSESGTTSDPGASLGGSRRASRPSAKKRPAELGVGLTGGGSDLTSPGDTSTDAKSRAGSSSVEEYRCRLCNYSGRSQHCLSKHYRAHDLAYKICRYCRRAFERPSDLLRHEERHRRRDVLGGTGGALDSAGSDSTSVSCSFSDVNRQPGVGRVDSYADGVVASSCLVSARLGPGDNEVILCFDEPAADALVSQPATPPPSKLRDVYSIMAGIFVNQQFFSLHAQSVPVAADGGGEQGGTPKSGVVEDRAGVTGTLVPPDFGQQAFLQMLDLKMVSADCGGSSSTVPGHLSPRGTINPGSVSAGGSHRERRRKGVPNRAVSHDIASDSGLNDASSDVLPPDTAAKVRCVGGDLDQSSSTFSVCNGVIGAKLQGRQEDESVLLLGYPRQSGCSGLEVAASHDKLRPPTRSRKCFCISCKVCGKRRLQGSELGRHWLRHSVQDADGCYSCSACSFTSNVRLIMHSHAHAHLIRSTTFHSTARCRLCARPLRRLGGSKSTATTTTQRGGGIWKTVEDGGLVRRSLWCSDCCRRLAASRLHQLASLRRTREDRLRRRLQRRRAAAGERTSAEHDASDSCV